MKKTLLLISALFILAAIHAQDALYISGGATGVRKLIIPTMEIGVKWNKNQLGFNVQTYDPNGKRCHCIIPPIYRERWNGWRENHNPPRIWVGDMRYSRIVPITKALFFMPNVTSGVMLNEDEKGVRWVFTGGGGLNLKLTNNLYIQTITQFPVYQNKHLKFKYSSVQNGLQLNYYIFK